MTKDWDRYTDWSTREFWPAQAAPKQDFGTFPYGRLPERFRRYCRTMLRGLEVRAPSSCTCGAGLRIVLPPEARYVPEKAVLTLVHRETCKWWREDA